MVPMVLTGYGLPHTMGYLKTQAGVAHASFYSSTDLMDFASTLGFDGIEIPLPKVITTEEIATLKAELRARNQRLVPDYHGTVTEGSVEEFTRFLDACTQLESSVVRVTLSRVLCGDRRGFPGGWAAHWEVVIARLKIFLPLAKSRGLSLAVENHQDVTSDDLLNLYEKTGSSPSFSICLDMGNALAVGEDPIAFAQKIGHLVRHAHCKDYTIHFAPTGYRLVRVAAGEGVVPFPEIIAQLPKNTSLGCEIAAQQTRTIPLLESSWWQEHASSQHQYLHEALRTLWQSGRPQTQVYGSAWERGEDSESVSREEIEVVRRSAAYFQGIL
jgi:3-oxoisoapionate decarboxylase